MAVCVFCRCSVGRAKLLMCLHSVCENCARTTTRSGDDRSLHRRSLTCPVCNQQTQLPSDNPDDVAHLPDDVISSSGSSTLEVSHRELVCVDCDGGSEAVTHQCVTCDAVLCELHSSVHSINPISMGHGVQPLETDSNGGDAVLTPGFSGASGSKTPLCLTHAFPCIDVAGTDTDAEDVYCITCGCVLCNSCTMEGTHSGDEHELVNLTQAESQQRGELNRLLPDFTENILPRLRSSTNAVNTALQEFSGNVDEAKEKVKQTAEELIRRITEERDCLLSELESFRSQHAPTLEAQSQQLTAVLEKGGRATRFGKALLEDSRGARFLHDSTWALDSLYDITAKMPQSGDDVMSTVSSVDVTAIIGGSAVTGVSRNPFDEPPPTYDNVFPVPEGDAPAATAATPSAPPAEADSSLTSADLPSIAALGLAEEQYNLEPPCSPRISFVDHSQKPLAERTLVGVLSRANIDHRRCSLSAERQLGKDELYGTGDDIVYRVRIVTADRSTVESATEVGLEIKAVLTTAETVSQVPCALEKLKPNGEFSITFQSKDAAEILLYASIDDIQLPGSPAVVKIGRYPFELDRTKSARTISIGRNGHLASPTSDNNTVVFGSRSFSSGVHRWRVRVAGLRGSDYLVLGICRPPFPTNFTNPVTSYSSVLGWSNKSQTLIKGVFRTINMEEWKDGDVVQLQVDFDKRSLELVLLRTGERSAMTGGLKTEIVPFFYLFSQRHKVEILPLPKR